MIDIEALKAKIDSDDIISLLDSLNVPLVKADEQAMIFYSACHWHDECEKHKPKLYVYPDGTCHCYSCSFHGDIISLIQQIKQCDFKQSIAYICEILHINTNECMQNTAIDPWQKELKRFLPNAEPDEVDIPIYDKQVLDLFEPVPHQSWLNDGINQDIMSRFNIGWYSRNAQITIPVFNSNGDLIGIHARNTRKTLVDKGLKYQPLKTLNCEYKFPTGQAIYGLYEQQDNIQDNKQVILYEAPKSTLQSLSQGIDVPALGMFGWNFNKLRRNMLLEYNINSVIIALDKQYIQPNGTEFDIYVKQVKKIANLFKPYCDVYVLYDDKDLLGYKDSPIDKGRDVFDKLYERRIKL